jgi:hypothetical protein
MWRKAKNKTLLYYGQRKINIVSIGKRRKNPISHIRYSMVVNLIHIRKIFPKAYAPIVIRKVILQEIILRIN